MSRYDNIIDVTIGATEGATTAIPLWNAFQGGVVYILTGDSITTLTWYAAYEEGGTFYAARKDGAALTTTVAKNQCCEIPPELAGAMLVKCVGNAAGTAKATVK